jgi:hypothetical protein
MYVTQQTLPPTWRDFEVYRLVKIERQSTRGAAQEMHLSQTRVCQVVARVAEFLVETAPAADDDVQRRKQLHVAEQVAAERLDFLQKQAMAGFNRSLEAVKVEGSRVGPGGDPRFLNLAARLSLMAAKLPTPTLTDVLFAPELDAEEEAAWAADEARRAEEDRDEEEDDRGDRSDSRFPPEEDCSTLAAQVATRAPRATLKKAAKPLPVESSISGVSVDLLAKLSETETVQSRARQRERGSKQDRRAAFLSGK